ncbi:MAG: DedA family protein [Actinobacteria bacterium]|nr:DedA family protein [Actinomycetota bacterium]
MHLAGITDAIDPQELLRSFGTIGLFLIVFAESGLLIGFFLPGDSLLFTAGLFASRGDLNIAVILLGCFLAAVIGDQVGYAFGRRVGPSIFRRPNSKLFKQEYVEQADEFFERHGAKTIVLARFVPIVRTFAPILAGVGRMPYRTFVTFNVIGGFVWAVGVTSLGYFLGDVIGEDNIDKYLLPIIAVIVFVSVLPAVIEVIRHRRKAARAASGEVSQVEAEAMAEHLHEIIDD